MYPDITGNRDGLQPQQRRDGGVQEGSGMQGGGGARRIDGTLIPRIKDGRCRKRK